MKVTLYVGWKQREYESEPQLTVWNTDYVCEEKGYINVSTIEIEVDTQPPSKAEAVIAVVNELRKKQGKLIAESNRLESRIQELLCIEYKPDEAEE